MTKKEAYRIVHIYPDKVIEFEHHRGNVTFKGSFTHNDGNYKPFNIDINVEITRDDGAYCGSISRRTKSIEDAVVMLWNGFNENVNIKDKYHSLETILFE